ncbi:zinc finger protein CONSTANS-LIKE 7 [Ziziphus jujuba]|uniref:Zinc finger protein CONSTANS-LIKE 7 n=2 Tax=Ziziphus jujuba TaxID=326968 RepID=A0ABM3IKS2_ZIZJJ|nr:zinc finger protein CONSTANS-LIKE 7 [Ziziphus jujuba]KAH7528752.1 hypothetical protein FEM48_Zijuj05G0105600 [Ziziphus jujuba var. spinosa]
MEAFVPCELNPCLDCIFYNDQSTLAVPEEEYNLVSRVTATKIANNEGSYKEQMMKKGTFLRLNYEAVITAWDSQASPWTTGTPPELNPDEFLPEFKGFNHMDNDHGPGGDGGGREARILRYKAKRRTRLLSKTIRYEVRKLNAEKRPRINGRFVKMTSLFCGD